MRQAVARPARSAIAPLRTAHREIVIDAQTQQRRADGGSVIEQGVRRVAIGADRHAARAKDARLLAADRLAGGAEIVDMIDRDGRDDGDIGVDDVHRVETPAQAHFEHHRVDPRAREQPQRGQGPEFEVRQRGAFAHGLDRGKRFAQFAVARFGAGRRARAR